MTAFRFAPSPTGHLHVGNLRTAIVNWLAARQSGGRFHLRLDDTDRDRSDERFAEAIRSDLDWLGISPDGEVRQSDRLANYEAAFERLRAEGRIYPAYETAEELDVRRKIQLSRGLPPVYDRAALRLTGEERAKLESERRRPHWRFRLDEGEEIGWTDLIRGPSHVDPASLSDPVVRRADGSFLYMLPSVVDDIDMGITHVVRGEDHVTNSGVQLQMFSALGAQAPSFAHMSLLVDADGGKFSKRLGSTGLESFRGDGIEPAAILDLLGRIGTSQPVEPFLSSAPLIDQFDFAAFGRAPARFDPDELKQLNAKVVHQLSYDEVADRLPDGMGEEGWLAIRPNLSTVAEAADWWAVVTEAPDGSTLEEDREFLNEAAAVLSSLDGEEQLWSRLTADLKQSTGRKGRALFLPLRRALTGRDHGPEMAAILPLIGREEAARRLRG
ncbi:glutamate--tRNA ligase [Pacificimonas flava]|uniref:Glutamate--tRNA ligase n=2 Tax=Pacificimonas TaxID=1960290 RepID=A0A219B562_9SPHN|nr:MULTISPECIES: glutamate--tRNA ligase [Pacificimonas]MBZ6379271.1 glutamate--tRNA ligase [Pacificimonas aurantium]OWV33520.1 glutamate--tRNA ligase [Pacificimonas flava]